MNNKSPKPKSHSLGKKPFGLPLKDSNSEIIGIFDGYNIIISDYNSMNKLYKEGCYGKGSLSKGSPLHHLVKDETPKIIFQHQYDNLFKWIENSQYSCSSKYSGSSSNLLEVSRHSIDNFLKFSCTNKNTDSWALWKKNKNIKSDPTNFKSNLQFFESSAPDVESHIDFELCQKVNKILAEKKVKLDAVKEKKQEDVIVVQNELNTLKSFCDVDVNLKKISYFGEENLHLNLQEGFFLKFVTNCLKIIDLNYKDLCHSVLWKTFNLLENDFVEKYITYHYYRSKGWVVKSGVKFGGHFLLYKYGPTYYHSSYLIQVCDNRKKMKWKNFVGINRLVETFNKDLIYCNIIGKDYQSEEFPKGLEKYRVQEFQAKRWFPSKERF